MKNIFLSLLILLLLACSPETSSNSEPSEPNETNQANETAEQTEMVESQAVQEDETVPPATETAMLKEITPSADESEPTATETLPTTTLAPPTPTVLPPTPTESPVSPVPTEPPPTPTVEPLLAPPESFDEAANWLAGAVADGMDVAVIQGALRDGGYLVGETDWLEVDLSGDGVEEWVVMVLEPTTENIAVSGAPGVVLIADRSSGEVSYQTGSGPSLAPELLQLEDFTGDGVLDLLYQYQTCGAHTCYHEFYVLSYHGATVGRQLLSNGDLNAPVSMDSASWQVEDRTEDGISDLVLTGGLIGSVGTGPQRAQKAVYAWNERTIALFEATYESANLRYFTLLDANDAFVLGNYDRALALYEEAATSDALQGSNWSNRGDEQSAIKRYAGFRLLLIHLWRNEIEPAQQWLNWLSAQYPADSITQAAQLLYDEHAQSKNLPAACAKVREYVQSVPDITVPLGDMGYANPTLTGETLCPY